MIILVSHPGDDHLGPVLTALDTIGHDAVVVDTATIPTPTAMSAAHSNTGDDWWLELADGTVCDLRSCRAGWWRRARGAEIDQRVIDPHHAAWAATEIYEAMAGFWDAVPVTWVSPPRTIERAMMKTWQLPTARAVGLDVPQTLVTSSPEAARHFIQHLGVGNVVCKAFSATAENWRETRLVGAEELDMLDRVALAPVIFQEFVPASVDLRLTVVGEEIFASAIHSQELAYPLDFRVHLDDAAGVRMEPAAIPAEVAHAVLRLITTSGLSYGAVDMRLTPDGRYVFLEVNPVGQWLFVEQITGQPITHAMAHLLARLDGT